MYLIYKMGSHTDTSVISRQGPSDYSETMAAHMISRATVNRVKKSTSSNASFRRPSALPLLYAKQSFIFGEVGTRTMSCRAASSSEAASELDEELVEIDIKVSRGYQDDNFS